MLKKGKKGSNKGQIRENMVKLDEISEQFYAENKENRGRGCFFAFSELESTKSVETQKSKPVP